MSQARPWVACFGEALIDFLAEPGGADGAPRRFAEYAGGAPANVAAAVARLGGRARFVGMLGTDMFGDFLFDALAGMGVDTRDIVRTDAAPTALAFVSLDADGERSFSFRRPPAADLLFRESDLRADAFDDVAVLHVCSNSLTEAGIAAATLAAMRRARAAGARVSMDVNLRPSLWPAGSDPVPRVWAALDEAEIVKLCDGEARFLRQSLHDDDASEAALLERLWQGRAQLLLVTDGARPLRWFTRQARGEVSAFRVRAVDTTAAGDAFMGGLLHAFARQELDLGALLETPASIQALVRNGAACGALATTRHGAFAAMPAADALNELLQRDAP